MVVKTTRTGPLSRSVLFVILAATGLFLWADLRTEQTAGIAPDRPSDDGRVSEVIGPRSHASDPIAAVRPTPLEGESEVVGVVVLGPDGRPVEDATVSRMADGRWLSIGLTDGEGALSVTTARGDVVHLGVTAANHVPEERTLAPGTSTARIQLQAAYVLEGRVRFPWGDPAPAGVTVVARRAGSPVHGPGGLGGRDVLGSVWTETDVTGAFLIDGLETDRRFDVLAAAPGFVCARPPHAMQPPRRDVIVEISPIHGVLARFTDAAGGRLRSNPMFRQVGTSMPRAQGRFLHPRLPGLHLSGVTRERDGQSPIDSVLLLYEATSDAETIGPLELEVERAGYAPLRAEIPLPRLSDPIATVELHCEPEVDSFGRLSILVVGEPGAVGERLQFDEPAAMIMLAPLDVLPDRAGQWFFPLDHLHRVGEQIEIDGVPHGRYGVVLQSSGGQLDVPATSMRGDGEVIVDGDVFVEFHLPSTGSLLLSLADAMGRPHEGSAVVQLTRLETGVSGSTAWRVPPFRLDGLPPGTYRVMVQAPAGGGRRDLVADGIEIEAGSVTSLQAIAGL